MGGPFSKDNVLDAINQLKAEKSDTEEQIIGLTEAKERIKQFSDVGINLDEWYVKAHKGIKDANSDTQRLAFGMLDLKVHATREKVDIKGIIPIELATTEQTSGCLSGHAYDWIVPFSFAI